MTCGIDPAARGCGTTPPAVHIADHRTSGLLEVTWADGRIDRLTHAALRMACRCAECEQRRRHGDGVAAAPDGLRLAAIHLVGEQGLNLEFTDGHSRGIYPWAWLRELGAAGPSTPEARKPWPAPPPNVSSMSTTGTTPCSPSAPRATPACASATATS